MVAEARARPRLAARPFLAALAVPVIAVLIAVAFGSVAILVAGEDVLGAYGQLVGGAIGSPQNLATTVVRSIPIVVVGLGIGLAFRAGVFNLGAEGQMVLGALAAAIVASALPGLPSPLAPVFTLAAGCLAGAAWAFMPGLLDVRLGVPILITSLLFNYIGTLFASWAVTYPFREASGGGAAQTATIPEAAWLPVIVPGTRLHLGVVAIVLLPFAIRWLLNRTVAGYEFRMVGHNRLFAEYAGIAAARRVLLATLLSGAICGLAGAIVVMGMNHRYVDTVITTAGWAWTGFTAAILTGAQPVLTLVAGLFLGGLEVGAAGMARRTDVPLQLVDVVQATIILVVAIRLAIRFRVRRALQVE